MHRSPARTPTPAPTLSVWSDRETRGQRLWWGLFLLLACLGSVPTGLGSVSAGLPFPAKVRHVLTCVLRRAPHN